MLSNCLKSMEATDMLITFISESSLVNLSLQKLKVTSAQLLVLAEYLE